MQYYKNIRLCNIAHLTRFLLFKFALPIFSLFFFTLFYFLFPRLFILNSFQFFRFFIKFFTVIFINSSFLFWRCSTTVTLLFVKQRFPWRLFNYELSVSFFMGINQHSIFVFKLNVVSHICLCGNIFLFMC